MTTESRAKFARMTPYQRLHYWVQYRHESPEAFSKKSGIGKTQLWRYLKEKGGNMPGDKPLTIFAQYGLNLNWYLTGEGEMDVDLSSKETLPEHQALIAWSPDEVEEFLSRLLQRARDERWEL